MKEKDLKRLSRADLLEMLIDQSEELQKLRERLEQAEAELQKREIAIQNAGSIAEASLMLNGVFEAAQAACREYVENTHKYCERREPSFACSYEEPRSARPIQAGVQTEYQGMPYAQYVKQVNAAPLNTYEKKVPAPVKPAAQAPAQHMHRAARYLGALDGGMNKS